MRNFSFKVQNLPTFKVLNLSKENFNGLALCYLSCTLLRPKFEKEYKKSVQYFLVKWKYLTLLYIGGGGKFALQSGFLLQLKNGWREIAETLWLLLLAYCTSFGILLGHLGPKLLPW